MELRTAGHMVAREVEVGGERERETGNVGRKERRADGNEIATLVYQCRHSYSYHLLCALHDHGSVCVNTCLVVVILCSVPAILRSYCFVHIASFILFHSYCFKPLPSLDRVGLTG